MKDILRFAAWIFLLTFCLSTKSQDLKTLYYDTNGFITTKTYAYFYRIAEWNKKEFNGEVSDYYMNHQLAMSGKYLDNQKTDTFRFYYPTGQLKVVGNYKDNKRDGIWTYFFPNGRVMQKLFFDPWMKGVITAADSLGNQKVELGNGNWDYEYYDGTTSQTVTIEGQVRNGSFHGTWNFYHYGKLSWVENWEEGILKGSRTVFGENWRETPQMHSKVPELAFFENTENFKANRYASREEYPFLRFLEKRDSVYFPVDQLAVFSGGKDSLVAFIERNVSFKKGFVKAEKSRFLDFLFVVNEQGTVTVKGSRFLSYSQQSGIQKFYDNISKAITGLSNWKPAIRNGQPVDSLFLLMATLHDSGEWDIVLKPQNIKLSLIKNE